MFAIWDAQKIQEIEFPKTGTTVDKLKFFLNYTLLAPSNCDTQLWFFQVVNEAIILYANRSPGLPTTDTYERELMISCGMALFNLRLALRKFGYKGEITTFPDSINPDILAYIKLGEPILISADEQMLFDAIFNRCINCSEFQDWKIPQSLLSWLKADAEQQKTWLYIVKSNTTRQAIAELVIQSVDTQQLYPSTSCQLITQSPVVAVLGTKSDLPVNWLNTGQALERILLRGQAIGLAASFLNQVIRLPQLRTQLNNLIYEQGYPQVLLLMGFSRNYFT
ncbi:nitroreductase [Chlorogloeopsis sp. ULAP01]|uniref:nitroreductase n=1 Tax=Chlorogloeopsis sp. ULAP01 TaxID=3056483 RepID=UPI0025AB166F|nr:nitroreductase [Chlorogloeopsis sp. ULAP01]MDM9382753.1 nitroreductase [Chlorogloeopsis sp. ULAP01]